MGTLTIAEQSLIIALAHYFKTKASTLPLTKKEYDNFNKILDAIIEKTS